MNCLRCHGLLAQRWNLDLGQSETYCLICGHIPHARIMQDRRSMCLVCWVRPTKQRWEPCAECRESALLRQIRRLRASRKERELGA